jgi:hypothetical protein
MSKIRLKVIGIALIGHVVLGFVEVGGADWNLIKTTDEGDFFYDTENVTRLSTNTVGIWLKIVYSDKIKEQEGFDHLAQTVGLWEIDCPDKMVRLLSTSHSSKEEEILHPSSPRVLLTPDWEFISPGTPLEALYIKVCN